MKGFTLIELMITVAIIGILAAIAIPTYQEYIVRAQAAEGVELLTGLKSQVAEYWNTNGAVADVSDIENVVTSGRYVQTVDADGINPIYVATFKTSDVSRQLQNNTISLTYNTTSGVFTWACVNLEYKFRPKACQ